MATRLLCAGDIHLGRRPSGLTAEAEDRVDPRSITPAAAWRLAVQAAIDLQVDAVLLAGDVVEQKDDYYEAFGHLSEGVQTLVASGIPVLGVTGNHDGLVLPRLAAKIPEFRLLGRNGTWESWTVGGTDGPDTRVLGWSFPGERFASDPLVGLTQSDESDLPTIGLLHCDRDASGSHYAPARSRALADAPVDAWLLGHIHKPDPLSGPRPNGYLGALTALDPSDEGARGPWLIEVEAKGRVEARHLPLAPLRFEPAILDAGELSHPDELDELVLRTVERLHARISSAGYLPRTVGLRIRLEGATDLRAALTAEADRLLQLVVPREEIDYFVQKALNATRPARDLAEIAASGSDPYALLATRLLTLDRNSEDEERRKLITAARVRIDPVRSKQEYYRLDAPSLTDDDVADLLRSAALAAMDRLERQREETS